MKKWNGRSLVASKFIFFILFIGIIVFFSTYYFFINKSQKISKNKINVQISNINTVNENTSIFTKGETINTEQIIHKLPNYISELEIYETNLKKIVVPKKYNQYNRNLLLGVKNNIDMYKNILTIGKNKKNTNLNHILIELRRNKDDCMNYYSLASLKGSYITLPSSAIKLANNSINYAKIQIELNINNQINYNENLEFLKNFDPLVKEFSKINKNYVPYILNIEKDDNEYNDILNNIKTTELNINKIKTSSSNISAPSNTIRIYQSFIALLDDYKIYIRNITFLLRSKQLTFSSNSSSNDSIENLYTSSEKEIKVIYNNYEKFMKIYNELKKKYNFELFF